MTTEQSQTEKTEEDLKVSLIADKKYQKGYWICTNIFMQYIPYLFAVVIGIFVTDFDFKSLVANGELIITAFALSSISVFSLFDLKKYTKITERLIYFVICLLICFFEIIIYTGIKIDNKNFAFVLGVSIVVNIATIISSIAANFYIIDVKNSIKQKEE